MDSTVGIQTSLWMGCPIRILKAHRLYAAPLERFAGLRVLLRLQAPRHPPRTHFRLFCLLFSSASTRADAQTLSKIEGISFSVGKVPIGFALMAHPSPKGGPQPLESGNQSGPGNLDPSGRACPVTPCRITPASLDLGGARPLGLSTP
jgi:hypothetical protein